jgi:outer membrane immunogenic protein
MTRITLGKLSLMLAFAFSSPVSHAAELGQWEGFYGGLHAGAAVGTADMGFSPEGAFRGPTVGDIADGNFWRGNRDLDSTGFTGGLYGGHLWRKDRFLFGIEADINYLGLDDSSSITATVPASGGTYRLDQRVKTDFFASLRPRLGYVPDTLSDDLLFYTTGGPALMHARVDQKFTQINVPYGSDGLSTDKLLFGWVAGGGVEYALSQQWGLKAEYLYADFGKIKNNAAGNAGFESYTTHNDMDLTSHVFRIGATYHF